MRFEQFSYNDEERTGLVVGPGKKSPHLTLVWQLTPKPGWRTMEPSGMLDRREIAALWSTVPEKIKGELRAEGHDIPA